MSVTSSPFLSGFASEVWTQRETLPLAPSPEIVHRADGMMVYTFQQAAKNRATRTSAIWRSNVYRTTQGDGSLSIQFQFRANSVICDLLRSLLSLCNFSTNPLTLTETRTWEPDMVDEIETLKVWFKDQNTGEVLLSEGCAVAGCTISCQKKSLVLINFDLTVLKTTRQAAPPDPGSLTYDAVPRSLYSATLAGLYFSQDNFANPLPNYFMQGVTRVSIAIKRSLDSANFAGPVGAAFRKTPASFKLTSDLYLGEAIRQLLLNNDTLGAMTFQMAEAQNASVFSAFLQQGVITFDQTSLHSSDSTNTSTLTFTPVQDLMNSIAPILLQLVRQNPVFDGGILRADDTGGTGLDGGPIILTDYPDDRPITDGGGF